MTQLGTAFGDWHGARLAGIALAVTMSVGLVPAAAAAPKGEPGPPATARNGAPGPEGNPGSARAQEVRATPRPGRRAHGAPGASKGRKESPSRAPKPRRQDRPQDAPPPQAKAGKTTICHSTGSAANPYVEITVSNNALKAHARHHDGRDIVPAPAGGCETETAPAAVADAGTLGVRRRVRSRAADDDAEVKAESKAEGGVLGVQASNPAERASAGIAEEEDEGGSLPFTGLALLGVLATAVLALAGGAAARRAAQRTDA